MSEYNKELAVKAQKKYIKENGGPFFAPKNGKCWKCGKNIYEPHTATNALGREYTTGITVERANNSRITGCPHCHKSYCS